MNKILTANRLLFIIIIIAAFLRLYNITELPPGLYPDEAMNGNNALEALSLNGHFKWFYPENNGREGLFINIQALSIYIFGNEPWALRGVSAIFGILTVLGVYLLTKEIFANRLFSIETGRPLAPAASGGLGSRRGDSAFGGDQARRASETFRTKTGDLLTYSEIIALLSAFFLATSFWHINFSRIGFRAIMAPFFITFTLYFLFKALNKNYSLVSGMLAGLFFGLGFHSYIAFRGLPILILIIFAIDWFKNQSRRKSLAKIFIGFAAISLIAFAPLGYYFIKNPQDFMGRTTQVSVFSSPAPLKDLTLNIIKTAGMFNFSGDYNWRHNYAGKPLLFWPVGILFLIEVLLGLRIHSRAFIILFSWLIIAALPIVISNEGLPHALRAIIMIPPVFILAGVGGAWLISKIMNYELRIKNNNGQKSKFFKFIIHTTLFIVPFILIFEAYNTYFIKWGKSEHTAGAFSANYVQIGRELNALPKKTPKYVIVETGGVLVRSIPMPAQTVMFITDTFTPEKQKEKNIFYILPNEKEKIPENSYITIIK